MPKSRRTYGVLKGTAILSLSGVVAGGISVVATPVYAHLYTPEQLGHGALLLAIATCVLPLTTWRLEYAIVNAREEKEVSSLMQLCFIATSVCALLLGLAAWVFKTELGFLLPPAVLLHMPVLVFCMAIANTTSYLFTRRQRFQTLGLNQIVQALARAILIVMFATTGFEQGVAHGYLLAALITAVMCMVQVHSSDRRSTTLAFDLVAMRNTLQINRHLVLHSLSTNFLNNIAGNLMPIVFSAHFTSRAAGYLFVLQQLIAMPAQVIAQAFWRTMFARLGQCVDDAERTRIVIQIHDIAAPLLLIPVLAVMCLANDIREVLRGDWKIVASLLAPFVAMVYFNTVSNITSFFLSFGKYRAESAWNITILALRTGAVFVLPLYFDSMLVCIVWYLIASCAVYIALNAYWAVVLRILPRFVQTNLLLVAPVFAIGFISSQHYAGLPKYSVLAAGIAALAGLATHRYRRISQG